MYTHEAGFVVTGRDPFSRFDYVREKATSIADLCDNCGTLYRTLYFYGTWADDKPPSRRDVDRSHKFCTVGCCQAFNGRGRHVR